MTCTVFSVACDGDTKIAVMARPSGGGLLHADICSIREQGFSVVVSLLTDAEERELKLGEEARICKEMELIFDRLPIPDLRVPALDDGSVEFLAKLRKLHAAGKSIVVHCRAGIGRSPMIAACVMLSTKCNIHSAFRQLSLARGFTVPETPEQREWAVAYEKLLLASQKLS
jgi:protein-tyrosine phosphatase